MSKYIVRFNDGSPDEVIVADRVFPDNGVFTFKKVIEAHKVVVSEVVKMIPMNRVTDVEFIKGVGVGQD